MLQLTDPGDTLRNSGNRPERFSPQSDQSEVAFQIGSTLKSGLPAWPKRRRLSTMATTFSGPWNRAFAGSRWSDAGDFAPGVPESSPNFRLAAKNMTPKL